MKIRRFLMTIAAAAVLSIAAAAPAAAAIYLNTENAAEGWNKKEIGDGYTVWYYVEDHELVKGWKNIGGVWYHFSRFGVMDAEEWFTDEDGSAYYLNGDGSMHTGWLEQDGKWYYCSGDGRMVKNAWCGDYYLGPDGAMYAGSTTPDGFYTDPQTGKWDPSKDFAIDREYLFNGEIFQTYDAHGVDEKPETGKRRGPLVVRMSATDISVTWYLIAENAEVETAGPYVYTVRYSPGGKTEPVYEYRGSGEWPKESISFDPNGQLVLHPTYGDDHDHFDYYFMKLTQEKKQ